MLVASHSPQLKVAQGDAWEEASLIPESGVHEVTQRFYAENKDFAVEVSVMEDVNLMIS